MSGSPLPTPRPTALAVWVALITVYLVWGSTYLAIRYAIETMPPFFMAATRFLVAGAVMYAWRRGRGDTPPSGRHWLSAAIIGVFLLVGGNGGVSWAEQRVASGLAALLVGTVPLWIVILDTLRPGGRLPSGRAVAAVLVGFGGVVLLIGPTQLAGGAGDVDIVGAAAVILAALLWSIGSLYSRRAALPASPLLGTGMEMLAGGAGLLVVGVLAGELGQLDVTAISARSLWGLAYLIVFGSWVGFTAYVWLLRVAPTQLVSTYAYVNPVVAILLGFLLASEPLTPRILVAAAIILASVALTTTTQLAVPKSKEAQPQPLLVEESDAGSGP